MTGCPGAARGPAARRSGPVRPLLDGGTEALVTRYDSALLDFDGVLYIGPEAVPGAPEAVAAARAAGMRVARVTNNASRTPQAVAAHLTALGVMAVPDDMVTSAQAAATLVAAAVAPGSAMLVIGGEGLDEALIERGLRPVRTLVERLMGGGSGVLARGRLAGTGRRDLRGARGPAMDREQPRRHGPDSAGAWRRATALIGVIAMATGRRPVAAGKPETPLHQEAVRRTGAQDPVVVGDRLDTDVEGVNRAGVASLLVLTGVTARPT